MSSSSSHDQQQPRQGHGEQAPALNKPQLAKKQTRRRLHRSRPYQERLLNMAEARREIVTALRIHRANMRHQRSEFQPAEQRQQPRLQFQQPVQVMIQQQSQAFVGVPVAMCYANSLPNGASDASNYSSSMLSYDPAPLEEAAPVAIGGQLEHLACGLPAQPLGLNLSFHGFCGSLDTTKNSDDSLGVPSPCRPPSVYMSPVTTATAVHGGYSSVDTPAALSQALDGDGEALHSVRGGEMQGCVELSETAANATAATSAWWTSKILESMKSGGESARAPPQTTSEAEAGAPADDAVVEAVGWPEWQWLCDGVGVEQQVTTAEPDVDFREMHIDDGDNNGCCFEVSRGDVALPCIDVLGEIEGWDDGDWFP